MIVKKLFAHCTNLVVSAKEWNPIFRFGAEHKAQVDSILTNIRSALRERLPTYDWMDEETSDYATQKLDAIGKIKAIKS